MPYIEIPVVASVTRPNWETFGAGSITKAEKGKGGDKGEPVTDAQIKLDTFSGKLPHDAAARGNRWVSQWLDYNKLRAMRRDPTIALARQIAVAPIIAAPWTVELTDNGKGQQEQKAFIEQYVLPLRLKLVRSSLYGQMDFGWRAFEKVFHTVKDDRFGQKVCLARVKPLLNDSTWASFDDEGDFNGLIHRDVNKGEWFKIDEEHSLFVNFDDDGIGMYADPVLTRCESAYDQWNDCNAAARRFDEKMAGAVWVIHYPEGKSRYKGERVDNYDIAVEMMARIQASGHLIIPSRLLADVETELEDMGQPPWKIELLEAPSQQGNFITRLDYLDKLKVRGCGVLERAMMEGNYGTKAEAA